MKENDIKEFFINKIDGLLDNYHPGRAEMKPDVLKQMEDIEIKRKEIIEKRKRSAPSTSHEANNNNNQEQMQRLFELQRKKMREMMEQIKEKDKKIEELEEKVKQYTAKE
jgi:thiamine kinase-like enzyme